ncbi:unnamed protein product, partial [Mesorhabditis spiculigera]
MLAARTLGFARVSARAASFQAVPTNAGRTPPKLEDFDPLNPGEWQLGAGGKILPRLPEGTRCGNLVMGKYGLYDPVLKKRVDTYAKALLDGAKSEDAGPFDRGLTKAVKILSAACLAIGVYNIATLVNGKPLPPFTNLKAPGSN